MHQIGRSADVQEHAGIRQFAGLAKRAPRSNERVGLFEACRRSARVRTYERFQEFVIALASIGPFSL
jgi:hypothetical protein